jgi:AbrB family looped-hinge helix DNA binding protein
MNATRAKIAAGGRIVIPAEYRNALGLKEGDSVVLCLDDNEIHLYSFAEAIRRAQDLIHPYIEPGRSLVDELIAERRREAALER